MESTSGSEKVVPLSDWGDGELLLAWRSGRRDAGEVLFERHYDRIARYFQGKVSEPEELIQRTFLAAIEAADRIHSHASSLRPYMLGIAYNILCNHFRQKKGPRNHAHLSSGAQACGPSPSEVVAVRQEDRILLAALRLLPLEWQTLLELYYWEEFTTRELAEALGWPLGTVRNRLAQARRRLEGHLRELTSSKEQLDTTLTRLDDWARALYERGAKADDEFDEDDG